MVSPSPLALGVETEVPDDFGASFFPCSDDARDDLPDGEGEDVVEGGTLAEVEEFEPLVVALLGGV